MIDTTRFQPVLLLLLSLSAGFTDAYIYLHAKVFPANMTGNSVVLAMSFVNHNLSASVLAMLCLAGFIAGTALGSLLLYIKVPLPYWNKSTNKVLLVEAVLFMLLSVLMLTSREKSWLVIASSVAMGLQGVAMSQLGVKGITTIVITGTISSAIAGLVSREIAELEHQPVKDLNTKWQFLTWIIYTAGAGAACTPVIAVSTFPFLVPFLILLICIICADYFLVKS